MRPEIVYLNCIKAKIIKVISLFIVIGKPNKTQKIIEIPNFFSKFGPIQKSYLTKNQKLGALTS